MLTRRIRLSAVLLALLSLFVLSGCGGTSTEPAATGSTAGGPAGPVVETQGLKFVPASITVKVGDTVTWRNTDGIPHTVTSGSYQEGPEGERTSENPDGKFDMPLAGEGATVSYTFTEPGTYPYFCRPHDSMNGTVIVEK